MSPDDPTTDAGISSDVDECGGGWYRYRSNDLKLDALLIEILHLLSLLSSLGAGRRSSYYDPADVAQLRWSDW